MVLSNIQLEWGESVVNSLVMHVEQISPPVLCRQQLLTRPVGEHNEGLMILILHCK